jgi:hypothetical protein
LSDAVPLLDNLREEQLELTEEIKKFTELVDNALLELNL